LGAVAGGLFEGLASFGFVSLLVVQVSAIAMLSRSFAEGHTFRNIAAVASLLCCGFMLLIVIASAWAMWYLRSMRP
jgi:hypothetical protein